MEIYKQINIIKTGRTYCLSHRILQLLSGKYVNFFTLNNLYLNDTTALEKSVTL